MHYTLLVALLLLTGAVCRGAELPLVAPEGCGVNIHFTGAPARDLDLVRDGGFRVVRMDFHWQAVEKVKGVYDFSAYDQLTDGLATRNIRALYILDYSNPLYELGHSVRSEVGRLAFARFAATAAARYRGKGIIWELWNEPNLESFWEPQPSVGAYMALAKVTFALIHQADPQAIRVAPATSTIAFTFLEDCFRQGLLPLVDAITVHPYRQSSPETVAGEIMRLRALIARYSPRRPNIPILSGEWGYSTAWEGLDEQRQGEYLPRQFLCNLSLGIPLSIWYDWRDDGADPKNPEHRFGVVARDYRPKPAYLAMQALARAVGGMRFVKRLQSAPADYLLLFADDTRRTIAAWTTGTPHAAAPIPGRRVMLSGVPQYLPVPPEAKAVLAEGAWTASAHTVGVRGGATAGHPLAPAFDVELHNPFTEQIIAVVSTPEISGMSGKFLGATRVLLEPGGTQWVRWLGGNARRDGTPLTATVEVELAGYRSRQQVEFLPVNPLSVELAPSLDGHLAVVLRNPAQEPFTGDLIVQSGDAVFKYAVQLSANNAKVRPPATTTVAGDVLCIALPVTMPAPNQHVRARLLEGEHEVADSGWLRLLPVETSADTVSACNDGDAQVPAKVTLRNIEAAGGIPGVWLGYDFAAGWKFVRLAPKQVLPISGSPHAIGMWVNGDGSQNLLRMRFVDDTGRCFQPDIATLAFTGWRFLTAPLDDPHVSTWGGVPDAPDIVYPIKLNTLVLLDSRHAVTHGTVQFARFVVIYRE